MFLGHYAAALAAKALAPRASLGMLTCAAVFADLLWPTLLLLDLERVRIHPAQPGLTPLVFEHYPISHSLLALLFWSVALGTAYYARARAFGAAVVVGALVLSHWLLDAVVHRPDLPLAPGTTTLIGLGLWNSTAATFAVEGSLFVGGLMLYRRATRGPGSRRWPLALYAVLLAAIFVANSFGPPPPSVSAIAWVGQAQWLLVAMAWWVDRAPARTALAAA
ncbi:MAG TPA: hypothetical protein VNK91_16760 [Burkholderiaceae bacterium]|jgi:membrane-bound metal-dependent hydrolase YbcI (DUF457 family)|nr:hypothetical protein [Burkholderiaceae bacterium]